MSGSKMDLFHPVLRLPLIVEWSVSWDDLFQLVVSARFHHQKNRLIVTSFSLLELFFPHLNNFIPF